MKTQSQIKVEIYNALLGDTTLPNEIYWTSQTNFVSFPCLVYEILNASAYYAYSGGNIVRASEDVVIQIDIYTDAGDMANMDIIKNKLNTVMEGLNYQNIDNGIEFGDDKTGKVIRPTRWARVNV